MDEEKGKCPPRIKAFNLIWSRRERAPNIVNAKAIGRRGWVKREEDIEEAERLKHTSWPGPLRRGKNRTHGSGRPHCSWTGRSPSSCQTALPCLPLPVRKQPFSLVYHDDDDDDDDDMQAEHCVFALRTWIFWICTRSARMCLSRKQLSTKAPRQR